MYCGFDMSKYSKTKNKRTNVMEKLEEIGQNSFKSTGTEISNDLSILH